MTALRWKLIAPHYLNVINGATWEYKEIDRGTGKNIRKTFPVPTLLDPSQSGDWTHKYNQDEGDIIVTNSDDPDDSKDLVFKGDPTPDMIPMNAEAETISKSFVKKWQHPIESLPGTFTQSLLDDLQRKVAEVQSQTPAAATAPIEGMSELLSGMAAMMKQNQELLSALIANKSAERRV